MSICTVNTTFRYILMEAVFLEPNEKRALPLGNKRHLRQQVSEIALHAGPRGLRPRPATDVLRVLSGVSPARRPKRAGFSKPSGEVTTEVLVNNEH